MLNERAKRLGNEVELLLKPLVGPAQSVEPDAEPFVEFGGAAPFQQCAKSVGEDSSLRRAWFGCERFQLLRKIIGQVELVPRLESFHGANSDVDGRLTADAGGRTSLLFDESRSDLRSGPLPAEGPRDVPSPHDSRHLFSNLTLEHRTPRHEREFARVLDDGQSHHSDLH